MEARDFRDQYSEFTALDAEVVGVSPDSDERHASFRDKLDLPFPLVADAGSKLAKAFGVARLGGLLPSQRVTFVIDAEGIVRSVISAELDVSKHARGALDAIRALG